MEFVLAGRWELPGTIAIGERAVAQGCVSSRDAGSGGRRRFGVDGGAHAPGAKSFMDQFNAASDDVKGTVTAARGVGDAAYYTEQTSGDTNSM